jgi:transketolase
VLPPSVEARLSVEAGISLGWERWVGLRGGSVAVDRFGASAPAGRIFAELGLTAESVSARARAMLEGR